MKTLKKLFALTLTLAMVISLFAVSGIGTANRVSAAENLLNNTSSNNFGMYAVPKKSEVNIDANFDEWDWSGRIMIFPEYDGMSQKGAEVAVMYDTENIYLGFKVKDETPMKNTRDPILEYSSTWRGDSFQIRVISDHAMWITTAYHENTDQYSLYVDDFPGDSTLNVSAVYNVQYYSKPGSTHLDQHLDVSAVPKGNYPEGIEICGRIDTQVQGTYYYEMKWPFKLVWNDPGKYPKAGDVMVMAFEVYWSDETGYMVGTDYKDNLQAGTTTRSFFYKNSKIWGNLSFIAENDIEVRQYVKDVPLPMSGYLKVPIEVPKDKDRITVVIENSKGERIRNLIAEHRYKDFKEYYVSETETTMTTNVHWDGRDDYGVKVSPGHYTFKTIAFNALDPVFDTVFYGPGQVPWSTTDISSGWLADHTPPRAIATYDDEVYVGAAFAEGGHGLMALHSNDGSKKWGTTLAAHLLEANEKYIYAIPGWDWTQDMTINLNQILLRYDRLTGKYNTFVINGEQQQLQMYMADVLGVKNGESVPNITGIAANNEVIAIATENITGVSGMDISYHATSLSYPGAIQIYDAEDLTPKKRIYIDDVRYIEFSEDGKTLYATVGKNEVAEVDVVTGRIKYLKLSGVDKTVEFSAITTDNDGNIVLFDMGEDCQIKAYNPETGKLVYTAAQEGGRPYDGDWEEQGLTPEVSDLAVDNNGYIWVTEDWNYPRRISKWNPIDGKLADDFIGATFYMSGNAGVSGYDPDLVYWGPVEMRVNREDCSYEVERILYIPDALKGEMFPLDSGGNAGIQQFESDASGQMKKYAFVGGSDASAGGGSCNKGVLYIETESGRYRPCFAIGSGVPPFSSYNKTPQYDSRKKAQYAMACGAPWRMNQSTVSTKGTVGKWIWNDYSCDGKVQADELRYFDSTSLNVYWNATNWLPTGFNWSAYMTDSLTFSAYNYGGSYYYGSPLIGLYSPSGFSEDGAPFYDVEHMKLVQDPSVKSQPCEHYYFEDEGTVILIPGQTSSDDKSSTAIRCIDVNTGELKWSYRNDYAGVAGSHSSPMQPENGVVIGSLKLMGVYHNSKGDKFFHIRGNMGCDYIITSDGYFVSTLFKDQRITSNIFPESVVEARGMSFNHLSTGGEPFGGNGATHEDGVTRFILPTGGRCAIVCRLENMDSLETLKPITVTFTQDDLDAAYAYVEEVKTDGGETEESADKTYQIMKATDGFTINGELDDWDGFPALEVGADGVTERSTVKVAYDTNNLYISFDTRDDSPMKNNGVDMQRLFKTGDVADLYFSPSGNRSDDCVDGDFRLTFSVYDGKEVAVLSKPVDSTAKDGEMFSYSSPVTTRVFDKVVLLSDAEIGIIRTDTGYKLEAKVPLSTLGITIDTTKKLTGDVGIIKSNDEGTQNLARIYYFNKNTGLISDLPGEAQLWPSRWGDMQFSDKDPRIEAGM